MWFLVGFKFGESSFKFFDKIRQSILLLYLWMLLEYGMCCHFGRLLYGILDEFF